MFIATLKQLKKQKMDITPENVQKVASKSTFEVKGLFGPTEFPDVVRALDAGMYFASCSPTARVGDGRAVPCSSKTFKVQQKYIDAA